MWWMPWRLQAKKGVAACEKLRGAGKRALIRRCPNGETRPLLNRLSCTRVHACTKAPSGQTSLGGALGARGFTRAQKPLQAKRGLGGATGESIRQGSHRAEYIGLS